MLIKFRSLENLALVLLGLSVGVGGWDSLGVEKGSRSGAACSADSPGKIKTPRGY